MQNLPSVAVRQTSQQLVQEYLERREGEMRAASFHVQYCIVKFHFCTNQVILQLFFFAKADSGVSLKAG